MEQRINYKGLTRLPSDISSFDGEMEEVINLVSTNGELRPYLPPAQMGTLTGKLMYVHKNQGWEHFVALDGTSIKAYKYESGTFTQMAGTLSITGETLRQITSIGNILIVLTDKSIHYSLCNAKTSAYSYLGTKLPFPKLTIEKTDNSWQTMITKSMSKYSDIISGLWSNSSSLDAQKVNNFINDYWAYTNTNHDSIISNGYITHPLMIRYAVRMYDGTLINHSMPQLIYLFSDARATNYETVMSAQNVLTQYIKRCRVRLSWTGNDLTLWKDIISSIDIFVSPPLYQYTEDNNLIFQTIGAGGVDNPPITTFPANVIYPSIINSTKKAVQETGNFYLLDSISLDRLKTSGNKILDTRAINSIELAERMTDDYHSLDAITAKNSFTYNHRLHLTGIERQKFTGFKLAGLTTYYYGTQNEAVQDVGSQPFLFYPGKSDRVVLSKQVSGGYKEKELLLTPHPSLNGSFYLDPNLSNISIDNEPTTGSTGIPAMIAFAQLSGPEKEPNKLYVSPVQNPFSFPAASIVTLPVGEIITVSSNTEAISTGQFGQFPLYVFTDDGIWAMEVSSDGRYMTRQPVSREVCINQNILQLDKHIAFISKKGLNILHGSSTECITDIIKEVTTRTSKLGLTQLLTAINKGSLNSIYNTATIEEYMQNCELAYEYLRGRGAIYLINQAYDYSYIFDIESKSWSKVLGKYRNSVANYPDCYIQKSTGQLFNLSEVRTTEDMIEAMYVTRPLKADDTLIQIKRLRQSGIFGFKKLITAIYGSRDGVNYSLLSATQNHITRQLGTPFKFFKIVAVVDLKQTDVLTSMQLDVEQKYTNRFR